MIRRSWLLGGALAAVQLLVVDPSNAQTLGPTLPDYQPVVPPKPEPPLATPSTFIDRDMTRPWSAGHLRSFVAVTIDAGYLYLRPKLSVGFGRPYSSWVGLDVAPIVSSYEVATYGGLRALFGPIDFRAGARYNFPFTYDYLPQEASYSRLDLESTLGGRATYEALETELKASVGVGPGSILAIASLFYIVGVPAGFDVYEDTLHTIVRPPLVAWGRAGYDFHFGTQGQHGIAVVGDVLYSPDRDATTVRAGLLLHIAFSHHFEIRGSFVPTVWSKDAIGLAGDDFTELGVRYRWATGD
ncbi:MAG TPA: hypothetical protein VIY73_13235 [Polyangiaceae bacterium]